MDIFKLLAEPFNPNTVKWRVGATSKDKTKAIALAYVDARIVMVRLDDVLGPNNWQDKYFETNSGRIMCELSVRIDGEWITKTDGAGDTGTEGEKGAISDAFKRAAVKFGIGRYLYAFPNTWVAIDQYKKLKTVPVLPDWALPTEQVKSPMVIAFECSKSIQAIKDAIADDDAMGMQEAWGELEEYEQFGLWKAPSKGGVFTTSERIFIQNNATSKES